MSHLQKHYYELTSWRVLRLCWYTGTEERQVQLHGRGFFV